RRLPSGSLCSPPLSFHQKNHFQSQPLLDNHDGYVKLARRLRRLFAALLRDDIFHPLLRFWFSESWNVPCVLYRSMRSVPCACLLSPISNPPISNRNWA